MSTDDPFVACVISHPAGGGRGIPQEPQQEDVPTLLQMKRERDILHWKLCKLDREIYAYENYDPEDVG